MGRVQGKVALVTGAASGIGAAIATALSQEGAQVVLADINSDAGQLLADQLGGRFVRMDVSIEADWEQVIAQLLHEFGRLDILVNNAGIVLAATIEDTSYEQLKRVQAVNIDGPFLGCKHAVPAMAAGGGGAIINMASAASILGTPAFAAYSASKGAVRAITQTVAVHCKQRGNGVRCNSIHPGGIDTPMTQGLGDGSGTALAYELMSLATIGAELGKPQDVAMAVVYLASDEASFINGAQLSVDNAMVVGG